MKKLLVLIIVFVLSGSCFSQTAINLFNQLPSLPNNFCEKDQKFRDKYLLEVNKVINQLEEEISKKNKAQKELVKNKKKEIEQEMIEQSGLSNSEVQKLKNKKMSKEEKKAIAAKMMMEKTGISMGEIEQLKKMSKEGKKNWAEAYGTQQQANLSGGGAENEKTPEQIAMEKNMKKSGEAAVLAKEQATIMARIEASNKKFANLLIETIKKDSVERIMFDKSLQPYLDKLNNASEDEYPSICKTIVSMEATYCQKITVTYKEAYKTAETSMRSSFGDYKRLAEINAKLNEATLGNKLQDSDSDELMQLQAVKSYAAQLLNTYKYARYSCTESKE